MEDADRDEEEIAETPAVQGEEEIFETPAVRDQFPPLEEEDGSTCVIMSCVESERLCGYLPYYENETNCHCQQLPLPDNLSWFSFARIIIHIIHISIRY